MLFNTFRICLKTKMKSNVFLDNSFHVYLNEGKVSNRTTVEWNYRFIFNFFFPDKRAQNQFSFGSVSILYLKRMLHIHFIYHLKSDNQEVIMWPTLGSYSIRA